MLDLPKDFREPSDPTGGKPRTFPAQGLRILLTDDDESLRRLIALQLAALGATVDVADDGSQAIRRLRSLSGREHYDLIVMDMAMPLCDGYRATATLRSHGYGGLIVALTAHYSKEEAERCRRPGVDAVLSKPIGLTELALLCERVRGIAAEGVAASNRVELPVRAVSQREAPGKADVGVALTLVLSFEAECRSCP